MLKDGKKVVGPHPYTPSPLIGRGVRMREGEAGWYKPAEGEDCEPYAYVADVQMIGPQEYAWIKVVDRRTGGTLATPVVPTKGLESLLIADVAAIKGATGTAKPGDPPVVSST